MSDAVSPLRQHVDRVLRDLTPEEQSALRKRLNIADGEELTSESIAPAAWRAAKPLGMKILSKLLVELAEK